MRLYLYVCVCVLFCAFSAKAQRVDSVPKPTVPDTTKAYSTQPNDPLTAKHITLTGKVEDNNTLEGLSFAVVIFPHTIIGATTDIDGFFTLTIDSLPSDTLSIQAMGYKNAYYKITASALSRPITIEMERNLSELKEVTVRSSSVDPAQALMKRIIARKPANNPDRFENYSYEVHTRLEADLQRMSKEQFLKIPLLKNYSFIFDNIDSVSDTKPFLPLYLTETISDFYYRKSPLKQREIIKASIVKGLNNENFVKYLNTLYVKLNIYNNYISIFNKKFISPLHGSSGLYYKYTIQDTAYRNGHRLFHVRFSPRRVGEYCFVGDFWVADSCYAIERVSLDVDKDANVNWVEKISLFQEYEEIDDSLWFCAKEKFIAHFTLYDLKSLPGFIGRKTTTYKKIAINEPKIDSQVDNPALKEDVTKLDSVTKKSDTWWQNNRHDSLTKNELSIYKMVDTIVNMPLTRLYKNSITFLTTGVKDVGPIQLGPYYYLFSRNPVEGLRFRLTIGTPLTLTNLKLTTYAAYGLKDKRWKYGFNGLWIMKRVPRLTLNGHIIHDVNGTTDNTIQSAGLDNIFSAFFRKPHIHWKLAFIDEQQLQLFKEYKYGFSHKFSVRHKQYTPYHPLPHEGIFTDVNNQPSLSGSIFEAGVELRFAYRERFLEGRYVRRRLANKYPALNVAYYTGIKGILGSNYQYQKIRFSVTETANIPPLGVLSYSLFAGKYFGTLPYSFLEIHQGNEFMYYNRNAFEMMNNYEFISDQYAGFFLEHNIGGGLLNRVPLLKKLHIRQFWTAKGIIGTLSEDNKALNFNKGYPFRTLNGEPYLELGTGVSNILHLFRIDFVWRVTPKPVETENLSRYFGIFGSVNFEF